MRRRPRGRSFLRALVAAVAMLLALQLLTALRGSNTVAAMIQAEHGGLAEVRTCRAIAPGLVYCEYGEPPNPAYGPKACHRVWSAYYAWRPGGWRRFDRRLILVS